MKTIQRFVRGWIVRKTITEMREQYRRCLEWENVELKKQTEKKEEHIKHNMLRMAFPQTHADFNMLYNMVERWRKSEVARIMADSTSKTPRKGEFYSLLEKEVQLLSSIEKHRIAIKEEKQTKRELDIINKVHEFILFQFQQTIIHNKLKNLRIMLLYIKLYHIAFQPV